MKIRELHPDIERYLLEDCYCPHEIYSFDGFYYQLFYEDQDCVKLGELVTENKQGSIIASIALPNHATEGNHEVVLFFINAGVVVDALRYDATENNIEHTKFILNSGVEAFNKSGRKFDEYIPGNTAKSLAQILSIADAIIID